MSNSVESFHRNLHRNINFSVIEKIELSLEVKAAMSHGFYTEKVMKSKQKLKN